MSHLTIQGSANLSGSIPVYGSKNAALPLLAATLLTEEKIRLTNIPPIADVQTMVDILRTMDCDVSHDKETVTVTASDITSQSLPDDGIGKLRGSILLLGALLGRTRSVDVPKPGGDIIGARPIDTHLDAFRQLGATIEETEDRIRIDGASLVAGTVVLNEFSVTATENVLLTCATLPGTSTIHIAAAEPHIVALAQLLTEMGATVTGAGTHTIIVEGAERLHAAEAKNIYDMLEAGLFMLMGAATGSEITIEHVPHEDLLLFFKLLSQIGIEFEFADEQLVTSVRIRPSKLKAFSIKSLPHPGIATDLQAPFAVIATQATGTSVIHDPLYEDRFKHIVELQKMGANAVIADPHRVVVTGPTQLHGRQIPSLDIRAGATLVLAGLVAKGTTTIDNAEIIERGYANLPDRLNALGANVELQDD